MDNSIKNISPKSDDKRHNRSSGRRSGGDRRQYNYAVHIPENRSGPDNRHVPERRVTKDRRLEPERRAIIKRWNYNGPERRALKFRRSDANRRTIK